MCFSVYLLLQEAPSPICWIVVLCELVMVSMGKSKAPFMSPAQTWGLPQSHEYLHKSNKGFSLSFSKYFINFMVIKDRASFQVYQTETEPSGRPRKTNSQMKPETHAQCLFGESFLLSAISCFHWIGPLSISCNVRLCVCLCVCLW